MKKSLAVAAIVVLASVIAVAVYLSMQRPAESNFNIVFRYGVGAKNELNTFNGTYTKDMVQNPPITASLVLTKNELNGIQQKVAELALFNLPSNFSRKEGEWFSTQVDYYLKIQNGSQTKEISWNDNSQIDSNTKNSLDSIEIYLIGIIEQRQEYKALPTPNGGYI